MADNLDLTCWDVYQMILNSKPISSRQYAKNVEFSQTFDDMYFNDAVEQVVLEQYDYPFVYNTNISIIKYCFVGTGEWGEPMEFLGGEDHYKAGKRIPGTIGYEVGINGDTVDENVMSYPSFEVALQCALYSLKSDKAIWHWSDYVTETIYQNNYNPNKFLSVYEFQTDFDIEYYVMQYIESYNPRLNETVRNNVGNRLGEEYHFRYSKADLDTLLLDYTEVG